jgi:hypothetical protein
MHLFSNDPTGQQRGAPAEPPGAEPEIIPPGADFPFRPRAGGGVFVHHKTRIHLTRLGPFAIAAILLGVGVLSAIALLMLLAVVLVGVAAAVVIVVAALLSRLLRGPLRP